MKQTTFYLLSLLFLMQCAPSAEDARSLEDILAADFEQHFISAGDNFPVISLFENDRFKFLVGLHNGFSVKEISEQLNWTKTALASEIDLLKENGYLAEKDGALFPAISIVMDIEGKTQFKQCEPVAEMIAESIIKIAPTIKQMYDSMEVARQEPYEDFKFFIMSDVLLDNWQINNVERAFLKKERTLRHGKRYYLQFAEKDSLTKIEVFGIYGNQYRCKDSICYITYGNNRKNHKKTFAELESMDIPLLSIADQEILHEMSELYRPELIKILEANRAIFVQHYNASNYKNELSFEEYFIWFYHFLYTRATDKLAEKQQLQIPDTGIFRVKLAS